MKLKKILIGIIFILSTFIILCLGIVFKNRFDFKVAEKLDSQEISKVEIGEKIEENVVTTDETIENVEQEEIKQLLEIEQPEIATTQTTTQEIAQTKKSSNMQSTKQASSSTPQTIKQESQTQVVQETIVPEAPKVQETPKVTEEKKESSIPVVQVTNEPTQIEEKYIRNDIMINKIKSVIENNPSEYMKTYGYNIVVDSSIKANANQFTFTETRVKSYIEYCFGTIRVYAEDYYKNGQLIMTECYLY